MTSKKTSSPKVSVLMPAYNSEKYVDEAIESILNQTFTDFEFIIINDGSTDNTAKIVKEYAKKDKRIKFIDNKKNQGVAKTRNELLDKATGEYVAWMDSDDLCVKDRLKIQVNFLDEHKEFSVVGTGIREIPSNKLTVCPVEPKILDFYISNSVPNATTMFRRVDIDEFRFNSEYKTAEDYEFWSRVIKKYKIYNLQAPLYIYRILNNSLYHNNPEVVKYDTSIRKDIIDYVTKNEVLRIKLSPKHTILLFGFIPVFKIKRTRIYLFQIIPLFKLRGLWWYLFDLIPCFKMKG